MPATIGPERMKGSWAGAIGNFQFMPSVFLRYAVDYDHDGHRNVWDSIPDAVGSAAHFLSNWAGTRMSAGGGRSAAESLLL